MKAVVKAVLTLLIVGPSVNHVLVSRDVHRDRAPPPANDTETLVTDDSNVHQYV